MFVRDARAPAEKSGRHVFATSGGSDLDTGCCQLSLSSSSSASELEGGAAHAPLCVALLPACGGGGTAKAVSQRPGRMLRRKHMCIHCHMRTHRRMYICECTFAPSLMYMKAHMLIMHMQSCRVCKLRGLILVSCGVGGESSLGCCSHNNLEYPRSIRFKHIPTSMAFHS